jgi:hypothetical protein
LATFRQLVLHQQREFRFFKFVEPVVPRYLFQTVGPGISREVETDDADVISAFGALDGGRFSSACFCPFADLIVVGQHSAA